MRKNPSLSLVEENYLFPKIAERKRLYLEDNPGARVISLGVGDTTEPLSSFVTNKLAQAAKDLGYPESYSGYGPAFGIEPLRKKIAEGLYKKNVSFEEVYLSDGAKSDLGRLQLLFPPQAKIAIQDPSYPVYVDTSVMTGKSLIYLPCLPENDFFPNLEAAKEADVLIFCTPNNPTGKAATKEQLETLVQFCKENQILLIVDAAYSAFIQNEKIPKSIYEIEGAREIAIEIGSFSKMAGFTGVRLGWTIVPKELPHLKSGWERIVSTFFNGPSNLAQIGGLAVLEEKNSSVNHYMKNAKLLLEAFLSLGYPTYGGENAPYLFVKFDGKSSWEMFDHFLRKHQLITTPGSGFGPSGEGFLRFSAFAKRDEICQAIDRLQRRTSQLL